ncbi:MAG: hypothetical protein WDM71_09525 [Ferruginibacter sp.]
MQKATLYNITDSKKLGYDVYVYNSHIEKNDLVKFLPANKYLNNTSSAINFSTHARGDLKNALVEINIKSKEFTFIGRAAAKDINRSDALQYDINITQGSVEKEFLMAGYFLLIQFLHLCNCQKQFC